MDAWPATWNPYAADLPADAAALLAAVRPRLFDVTATGQYQWDADWLAGAPVATVVETASGAGGGPAPATALPGQDESSGTAPSAPAPGVIPVTVPVDARGHTVVTYVLNPQARWGDGVPLTVDDFRATWQTCVAAATAPCQRRGLLDIADITVGPTPQTIVVTYATVYPNWRATFQDGPLRSASADPASFAPAWAWPFDNPGWLAGPFAYDAASAPTSLALIRSPVWWGDPAVLDSITVEPMPAAQRLLALRQGALDASAIADANFYARAAAITTIELRRTDGAQTRELLLNAQAPALADLRVRQAVAAALDRTTIARSDLAGYAWSGQPPQALTRRAGDASGVDLAQTTGVGGTNLAQARTLLESAGWEPGADGTLAKDGAPLRLTYTIAPGDAIGENEGFQIRAQLAAVGVAVSMVYAAGPGDAAAIAASGAYTMLAVTRHDDPDRLQALERFASTSPGDVTRYADAKVDLLLSIARGTASDTARDSLLDSVETAVWRGAVVLPLYAVPQTVAATPSLANYGANGWSTPLWEDVGFRK